MKKSKTTKVLDEVHGRYRLKIRRSGRAYLWEIMEQGIDGCVAAGESLSVQLAYGIAVKRIGECQDIDAESSFWIAMAESDPNFGVHPDHQVPSPMFGL